MVFSRANVIILISCLCFAFSVEVAHSTEKQAFITGSQLSETSLRKHTRAMTVKIMCGQTWGSGILIQKKGQVYTVLTNAHVLRAGNSYQIQTPDGKIYPGLVKDTIQFDDDDLGLLTFKSWQNYAIAPIAKSALAVGDKTFAAGFPNRSKKWLFTEGKVDYILPKSFQGGYQIGYSNDVFKGMSGESVVNHRGELVAINGRHKFPLWGNLFIFEDGSTPSSQVRSQFERSSWAVPVQTFLERCPQLAQGQIYPLPDSIAPITPMDFQPTDAETPKIRSRRAW